MPSDKKDILSYVLWGTHLRVISQDVRMNLIWNVFRSYTFNIYSSPKGQWILKWIRKGFYGISS